MAKKEHLTAITPTLKGEVLIGLGLLIAVVGLYLTRDRWLHSRFKSSFIPGGVEVGPVIPEAPDPLLNAPDVDTISFRKNGDAPVTVTGETEAFHVDPAQTHLTLSGTYQGRSFTGRFLDTSGVVLVKGTEVVGGSVTLLPSSFRTEDLTIAAQLQDKPGFDAMTYPTISFDVVSLVREGDTPILSGMLIIKGVQKDISFPLKADGKTYTGEVTLSPADLLLTDPALGPQLTVQARFGWK